MVIDLMSVGYGAKGAQRGVQRGYEQFERGAKEVRALLKGCKKKLFARFASVQKF